MRDKTLCQFFTKNADYILQGFGNLQRGKRVVDPFAGAGDLLQWASRNGAASASGLDIDRSLVGASIEYNDSLAHIPAHQMTVANPPFQGVRNGDLYLVALDRIIEAGPEEMVGIVPV